MAEVKKEKATNDRLIATLAHLSGFVGFVMPFGNIVVPLLIWLIKKDTSPYVGEHAKEALNFQISILIYVMVAGFFALFLVGFLLFPILIVFAIIVMIKAAIKANSKEHYHYPLTLRFIK